MMGVRAGRANGRKSCKNRFFQSRNPCEKWTSLDRQSDKILRQVVRLKKDKYIVIEHNSTFSQFLAQNFELFLIWVCPESQILRVIPWDQQNLRIIVCF